MPDTYTDRLALIKPEVGASRDSWGSKTNANWDSVDELLSMATPIGMIADFAGGAPPSGWLVADGRLLSRTTYSALFAAIGTAWGAGDGSTTFALPNLAGRAGVGPGTATDANGNTMSFSFSQRLGALSNHILQAHLPNYAMATDVQGYHAHGGATAPGGNHVHGMDAQGYHSHGGATVGVGDHTHGGYADWAGDHQHYTSIPADGTGVSGGAYTVTSSLFGSANYWTTVNGNHYHNLVVYAAGAHAHTINADGNHAHNIYGSGNFQLGIYGDGSHQHTIYLGGSSAWFPVMQPIIVVTKIIFAGTQAAVRAMSMAADASAPLHTIEGEATELLDIREELRQLRQLLATMRGPAQQRRIAAPLRGPH